MKKLTSIILTVIIALSCFGMTAFAESPETQQPTRTDIFLEAFAQTKSLKLVVDGAFEIEGLNFDYMEATMVCNENNKGEFSFNVSKNGKSIGGLFDEEHAWYYIQPFRIKFDAAAILDDYYETSASLIDTTIFRLNEVSTYAETYTNEDGCEVEKYTIDERKVLDVLYNDGNITAEEYDYYKGLDDHILAYQLRINFDIPESLRRAIYDVYEFVYDGDTLCNIIIWEMDHDGVERCVDFTSDLGITENVKISAELDGDEFIFPRTYLDLTGLLEAVSKFVNLI